MPVPRHCFGSVLAPARLRQRQRNAMRSDCRGADQASVHLGLTPSSSAIRYCLKEGLRVRLLEWAPASRTTGANGLAEYAQAIGECVVKISGEGEDRKPFLLGHSLGGTLAAIFGAMAPESIRGLVLLGAPLCFRPATSQFRDALVSLVPSDLDEAEPCPGSLLTQMSALASPDTFVWSRTHGCGIERRGPHRAGYSCARRALGSRRSSSPRQIRPSAH